MSHKLRISMLGGLTIRQGEQFIDDSSNRMRKVWLLLAYLIYSRGSHTTQEHYLALLQGSKGGEAEDLSGRLKALFYRARAMLDQVAPDAGHKLIIRKNGTYCWNTEFPIEVDTEEFDRLRTAPAADEEARLALNLQALALYQGDFLPKLSMEHWVMPISAYYHQVFLDTAIQTLSLLEARSRWEEAAALCRRALKIEPYSEAVYQHLMRSLLALEDRAGAVAAYEQMSEVLFDTFGVMPSDESRLLYREATKQANTHSVTIGAVKDQLREPAQAKGAMFCEYDFFRLLYQVQARSIIRSGEVIHIALLSVHGQFGKELSRRSLDTAVENLKELILGSLRQGDVVSQCSMSQLVIMLPQANYENSCAVCQRIIKAFNRQYPHSPAEIKFHVHPLEPMLPETAKLS